MIDLPLSSPSAPELDSRVIGGWAALEHGDLEGARAALQDVYSVDPAHPALPQLAAGIRRARPKPIPWRGIVLLLGLIAVCAFAWRASIRAHTVVASGSATVADLAANQPEPPAVVSPGDDPVGTAGRGAPPQATSAAPQAARGVPSDEVQIRQAIARFAAAYSNRWTPLTFPSCEISRSDDTASVTCQSRMTSGSTEGTWVRVPEDRRRPEDVARTAAGRPAPVVPDQLSALSRRRRRAIRAAGGYFVIDRRHRHSLLAVHHELEAAHVAAVVA